MLPSVSVGTFSPGGISGYSTIFDMSGAGTIFSAQLNPDSVLGNPMGSLITLAKTQNVDMSGIKLTDAAIPVTMSNVGYILDKVKITHWPTFGFLPTGQFATFTSNYLSFFLH